MAAERTVADAFRQDGFYLAKSLYTPEEMIHWKDRIIRMLEKDSVIAEYKTGVRVFRPDTLDPYLRDRMRDDSVVDILKQIIGPHVEFLSVKAVFKNKNTRFGTPWHQDWYYWKGVTKISVWIALDNATPENGCLKLIPGSHRKRYRVKQVKEEQGFGWRLHNEEVVGLPEVTVAADRGDAIFFHDQALHSSHPNTTGADRWCFISTYRDASVKDESTTWPTAMPVCGESVNIE